jgi:hypothetical protein
MQDKIYMLFKLTCDTLVNNITLPPAMVAPAIAYVGDAFWNSTFGSSRQLAANMGSLFIGHKQGCLQSLASCWS